MNASMKKILYTTLLAVFFQAAVFAEDAAELSKKLMPGVVTVYTETGIGSGFILDKSGLILTNAHVISKLWDGSEDIDDPFTAVKERVLVIIENKYQYPAEVVGYDARVDVALLKINPDRKLTVLSLGDSDNIKLGEKIVVLGSPFGLEETATAGVISHVGRPFSAGPGWEFPVNVIQTDAAINPGNSGGPMINIKGEVIGINYASAGKSYSEGIGFAIPINIARYIKDKLSAEKTVKYSYIGLDLYPITNEFTQAFNVKKGLLVETVYLGSPAEKVGLKTGDVIVSMNGKEVFAVDEKQANDFQWILATLPKNEEVTFELLRHTSVLSDFKRFSVSMRTVDSPLTEIELKQTDYEDLGLAFKDITTAIYYKFRLPSPEGIWVSRVSGGPAKESEFQVGDVINKVGDAAIKTQDDFENAVLAAMENKQKYIAVEVTRDKSVVPLFLSMRYQLKDKNALVIALSDTLPYDMYEALRMKALFYGLNIVNAGVSAGKDASLVDKGKEKDTIVLDKPLDAVTPGSYDAVIMMADKLSDKYPANKDKVSAIIKAALKQGKIVTATGEGVVALIEMAPELADRKITCDQKYLTELKKYDASPTGSELETDEKLVTATGSKETYKPFAYQIIKLLKD